MSRKTRGKITQGVINIVLSMAAANETIEKISQTTNLHRKTINEILRKHEDGLVFTPAVEKYKETCRRRKESLDAVDQVIFTSVACNNSLIIDEIKEKVTEQLQINVSNAKISRKLRQMKITRKRLVLVPKERNTEARINERAIFAADIGRFADDQLVFLDETGFSQHTRRSYGYSSINSPAYITVPANRGINRSVMCAIDLNGLIASEYRTGSYTSETFIQFIENKLVPYFRLNPRKILIMDNARIHKTAAVERILQINGIPSKFLTPYSPELNPIEEFFSMLKARYYSIKTSNPDFALEACISQVLSENNDYSTNCQGFYRNMRRWLDMARRREFFA